MKLMHSHYMVVNFALRNISDVLHMQLCPVHTYVVLSLNIGVPGHSTERNRRSKGFREQEKDGGGRAFSNNLTQRWWLAKWH